MVEKTKYQIKESRNLSPRVKWLRDYYFKGVDRKWNNEYNGEKNRDTHFH